MEQSRRRFIQPLHVIENQCRGTAVRRESRNEIGDGVEQSLAIAAWRGIRAELRQQ